MLAAAGGNTDPYEDIGVDMPPPAFVAPAGTPTPPVDELAGPGELAAAGAADAGAVPPANGAAATGPEGVCGGAEDASGGIPPAAALPAARPRPNSLPSDAAGDDDGAGDVTPPAAEPPDPAPGNPPFIPPAMPCIEPAPLLKPLNGELPPPLPPPIDGGDDKLGADGICGFGGEVAPTLEGVGIALPMPALPEATAAPPSECLGPVGKSFSCRSPSAGSPACFPGTLSASGARLSGRSVGKSF
ncbi:hypothetical protein EB74_10240 [Mycobacterium sp. SWH-M5]|nr:hypothetical protein EB74_10240 [Mycobacterium sp. SWH-M5]